MKKLLLVIDYQVDFVTGNLGFPKAVELEPKIIKKIQEYRAQGHSIAFTMDTHGPDYLDTQEGRSLPVPHCIQGTPGWELYGGVRDSQEPSDVCFHKPSFGSADLFLYLQEHPYESIELVGLVTNLCVLFNTVLAKTAQPETPVFINPDCVASYDEELHQQTLRLFPG